MVSSTQGALIFEKNYWLGLYATPRAWAHKGENLIHAFEAVAAASDQNSMHLNMNDQALMLAGMAAEVQLKAILVNLPAVRAVVSSPKSSISGADCKLWKTFYDHNLSELATASNIKLSTAQRDTAKALSQYIFWRGRYVIPTERGLDDLLQTKRANGLVGQAHQITIEEARDLLKTIVEEVKAKVYS